MIAEHLQYTAGWISWGSIFAGALTALAISIVMAVFGVALGFAVIKPKSDDPASGLGMAFSGWSFVSVVASLACGGFVAGLFAGQRGIAHGFVVWALVTIVACGMSGIAVSSALKTIGIAIKTIGSGAAEAVSLVGKGASDMLSGTLSELRESIDLNVNLNEMSTAVTDVLRDTGVESLQPEYLQNELQEARSDFKMLLRRLALRPADYSNIISGFFDTEKDRLNKLTDGVDKEAAVQALMRTRNIPQDEAGVMVDNAVAAYEQAVKKAKRSLTDAKAQINDLKRQIEEAADKARDAADTFSSAAATAALAAGIAMVLGAIICASAGYCGNAYSADWFLLQSATIIR